MKYRSLITEIEIILNNETEKSKKTEEVYTSIKDFGFATQLQI